MVGKTTAISLCGWGKTSDRANILPFLSACQKNMGILPKAFKQLVFCPTSQWLGRATVSFTFICLSLTLSSRFYWEPQLTIGEFVNTDLKSPKTIEATDIEATRQAKERARQEVPQVYRVNPNVNSSVTKHLNELLVVGDRLIQLAGEMPYTNLLSYRLQQYLRASGDVEWQTIREIIEKPKPPDRFAPQLQELISRKNTSSAIAWQNLRQSIYKARQGYQSAQLQIAQAPEVFRKHLLNLRSADWRTDQPAIRKALQDILNGGLMSGLPQSAKQYRLQNSQYLPPDGDRRILAIGLLNTVLVPNLQPDYVATEQRISKVMAAFQDKVVTLRKGEVIVKAGQQITAREFVFLDSLGLTQRRPNLAGIILVMTSVAAAMVIFAFVIARFSLHLKLKVRDLAGISLVCISTAIAAVILTPSTIAFIPLASIGLILGSFYGSRLATLTTLLCSGLVAIALSPSLVGYLPIVLGAVVGSVLTNRPNTRSRLSIIGIVIALLQSGSYIVLSLLIGDVPSMLLAVGALQYATSGLISSITALGAIPYLEQLCYAITPIRLAELANLDRPLLKKLVTEAPGTFQHTLFVANLAEAGARALGADTALVRTGTLYHDVGKTLKPEYFIENQMGQPNPHEAIDDPWLSTKIIREHVTGGIKLAQKFRLPPLLQTFIPEHQGTIVMSYFYHQARLRSPLVSEDEFRYAGPIPQSRETGIVMLADASEAALRSLGTETTIEEGSAMVLRIFQSRWNDGQLKDCSLTLADLDSLSLVFVRVWRERNHGRIKYPIFAQQVDPTGASLPTIPEKVIAKTPITVS